jgi:anti-sigma regulatory factor (Ser/Thr protein kinase)
VSTTSISQRIPLAFAEQRRRNGTLEMMRMLRGLELECRTREDAEGVADVVAGLLPDPLMGRLGLVELLLNAIEHGNLEIGKALKGRLIREHRFEDELAARLDREPYRSRRVHVRVTIAFPLIEIEISDEGPGFPWRSELASEVEASDRPNGRGIALVSRTCFTNLEYRDPGNIAVVKVTWPR